MIKQQLAQDRALIDSAIRCVTDATVVMSWLIDVSLAVNPTRVQTTLLVESWYVCVLLQYAVADLLNGLPCWPLAGEQAWQRWRYVFSRGGRWLADASHASSTLAQALTPSVDLFS